MLWPLLRAFLFLFDAERVHRLAHALLALLGRPGLARRVKPRVRPRLETRVMGLDFEHPVGLAAGFDKGEVHAAGLFALGFSHVEIGTITPRAQPGNDPPRLFRLPEHRALLNRMGFNNDGSEAAAGRLSLLPPGARLGRIGVNVGRNKDTPNERAEGDYVACIERLHHHADYLVVNLSSPNTPGLRELQDREPMTKLLSACAARVSALGGKPLAVKIAPDLSPEAVDDAVDVALAAGAAALICTNTTIQRPGAVASHALASEAGGLSGAPLRPLALEVLRRAHARAQGRLALIGVGGIMTAEDAYARLRAGASLVQVYTGFIYGGPRFAVRLARGLESLLRRDGFTRIADVIGIDARK